MTSILIVVGILIILPIHIRMLTKIDWKDRVEVVFYVIICMCSALLVLNTVAYFLNNC